MLLLLVGCNDDKGGVLGDTWTTVQMPERRLETATGALGTRLVLAGGFSASMVEGLPITTKVLTYDTQAVGIGRDPWGQLPDLPVAWTHANVAAVAGAVYVLGGLEGRTLIAQGDAFVLEAPREGVPYEWTRLPSLPPGHERGASAVVVSPGHIFLLGGASTTGTLATNLDFDLATREWIVGRPIDLPTPRSHAAAMRRYDGAFVLAGGLGDLTSGSALGDTWLLPQNNFEACVVGPGNPCWEIRDPMPTARGGCAYGVVYGNLICAGGEAGLEALDVVESYNSFSNVWTTFEPMPEPRAGARGIVVANRLYVPGGSATLELEPTDTLFELAPFVATAD